jgi:MYXO-CTERM domain-containing protein
MKRIIPVALIAVCFVILPAAAVILEVTVSGTVTGLDRQNNTLTIAHPVRYGCTYPPSGDPLCSFNPMDEETLTGTVPADSVFSVFAVGDPIVATSLGGPGGTWIAIAKLTGLESQTVMDIVGDPDAIPVPLAGDYRLELSTEPDCTTCSGTTCTAVSSLVKVMSGTALLVGEDVLPGHAMTYNGRNDGSSISVTFMKGQASSFTCAGRAPGMAGPQPVSVYIVHVVPPIGSVVPSLQETPAVSPTAPPEVTMPVEARPTTTKSGMLPFAAVGALALAAAAATCRRR